MKNVQVKLQVERSLCSQLDLKFNLNVFHSSEKRIRIYVQIECVLSFCHLSLSLALTKGANFQRIFADNFGDFRIEPRLERIEIRKLSKLHGDNVRFLHTMTRNVRKKFIRIEAKGRWGMQYHRGGHFTTRYDICVHTRACRGSLIV